MYDAGPYLDILRDVKNMVNVPVSVYQVRRDSSLSFVLFRPWL